MGSQDVAPRSGPREAGNGPAGGSGGSRLRRRETHGIAATELSRGRDGGARTLDPRLPPLTLARGYQDLKILDPGH